MWSHGHDSLSSISAVGQHADVYLHHVHNRPPPVFVNGIPSPYSDLFSGTSTNFDCGSPVRHHLNMNNVSHNTPSTFYFSPDLDETHHAQDINLTETDWSNESAFTTISRSDQVHAQAHQPECTDWNTIHRAPKYKSASPPNLKAVAIPSTITPASLPMRPKSLRRSRTESVTANERNTRSWKAAHNLVERNYRDRLNDQITELSNILFECPDENTKGTYHLMTTVRPGHMLIKMSRLETTQISRDLPRKRADT